MTELRFFEEIGENVLTSFFLRKAVWTTIFWRNWWRCLNFDFLKKLVETSELLTIIFEEIGNYFCTHAFLYYLRVEFSPTFQFESLYLEMLAIIVIGVISSSEDFPLEINHAYLQQNLPDKLFTTSSGVKFSRGVGDELR